MCAAIAAHPERIFPRWTGETRVTVEAPVGRGFVDVLAVTDAPAGELQVLVIEVKTRDEQASAGDVIRQLKWYRAQLPGRLQHDARLVVVVENDNALSATTLALLQHEGIEVLPAAWFEEGAVA
jgi:hypothetical protein